MASRACAMAEIWLGCSEAMIATLSSPASRAASRSPAAECTWPLPVSTLQVT
jgi:hypothetical protein